MRDVYRRYPGDPDVAVLCAEALMDLHPWDYWTPEIESILTRAMAEQPRHPDVHHLYIHLLENSPFPERTVRSADVIREMLPLSGHLVHMAGHAY